MSPGSYDARSDPTGTELDREGRTVTGADKRGQQRRLMPRWRWQGADTTMFFIMAAREQIHRLVDELPDDELDAAKRYLQYLRDQGDPFARLLANAPLDDEETTPEEDASAREAWDKRHESISAEEARRKYQ